MQSHDDGHYIVYCTTYCDMLSLDSPFLKLLFTYYSPILWMDIQIVMFVSDVCMYVNILQNALAERDVRIVDLEVTVSSYSVLINIYLHTHLEFVVVPSCRSLSRAGTLHSRI